MPVENPDMTFVLIPNSQFVTFGVPFTTNELGFRDRPIQPKTGNMFRILCIGDSVTYGTGVSNEEAFPNALESLMQRRAGASLAVDVINAGISAYSARNIRGLLQTHIASLQPDTVVYTFVENDLDDSLSAGPGGWLMEYDPAKPADAAFIKGSFAPAWVLRWQAKRGQTALGKLFSNLFGGIPDVVPPLVVGNHAETIRRWEGMIHELQMMRDLCTQHGARLVVFSFGTRGHSEPGERRIREVCKNLGIPEASTLPIFDHHDYNKKHSLGYDPHCNPAALRLMTDRLYAFLEEQRVIPDACLRAASDRTGYTDLLDLASTGRMEAESLEAPDKIVPDEGEGMIGVIGGIDLEGRMARTCIVRLGGKGNAIEVDANSLLASPGQPSTLSASIEGGSPAPPVVVNPQTARLIFSLPPGMESRQIEIELVAGGPSYIPKPEERVRGMEPFTLAIHRIARTHR
jgi:hypothetical protein